MLPAQIKEVQTYLNNQLPYHTRLVVDGVWGAKSRVAAIGWQTGRGQSPTGKAEDVWAQMPHAKPFPRVINNIVLHCAASHPDTPLSSIQAGWKAKGWEKPGYHRIIAANGEVHNLLPYEQVSNGVAGHNADSIHISYIGGVDKDGRTPKDTRTPAQIAAQYKLIAELRAMFPNARILGHRDFPGVSKACPSYDVRSDLRAHGVDPKW